MQTTRISLADLQPNTGQIPGLPMNPRQWTKSDVERIARSLKETPELFEARPIIAVPFEGKYVILGGNLRYEGARHNKDADAPVCVLPEDTPAEKMKEIVVKDNGQFGAWDFDALANEWYDLPLTDWGVAAWNPEEDLAELDAEDDNYSRKIEAPIYEPKMGDVRLSECVDLEKYNELLAKIEKSKVSPEEKDFLRQAAGRHIVFDYARIADYYANASPTMQSLMEDSALIIIDFGKAVEGGFIKMSEELRKEYLRQNG